MAKLSFMIWVNKTKTMTLYRSEGNDGRREKDLLTLSVLTRRDVEWIGSKLWMEDMLRGNTFTPTVYSSKKQ